jgi:chemotaxis protein methyltransferase CheR
MTPALGELKRVLIARTGLAYYEDKDADFVRGLEDRRRALALPDLDTYCQQLLAAGATGPEFDELVCTLTIGETYFFRHPELFEAFRSLGLDELLRHNESRRVVRIWSAGCATGAEPYTVAILLADALGALAPAWRVEILGTDINRRFLAQAEQGRFNRWALRGLSQSFIQSHFIPDGELWAIRPEHRQWVSFRYHNLHDGVCRPGGDPAIPWDAILCRNVLIYFAPERVRQLVEQFHAALADGGWLLIGHSEPNLEFFRKFETINTTGAVLYRKPILNSLPANRPGAPAPPRPSTPGQQPLRPRRASPATSVNRRPAPPDPASSPRPRESAAAGNDRAAGVDQLAALMDVGDWAQALDTASELLATQPASADLLLCKGLIHEQTGQLVLAERELRRALYIDRAQALTHYRLGLLLAKAGKPDQARKSLANARKHLAQLPADHLVAPRDHLTAGALLRLVETAAAGLLAHAR